MIRRLGVSSPHAMADSFPSLVVDYLKSLERRGIEQIPIDEEARLVLRQWVIASRQKNAPRPQASPSSVSAAVSEERKSDIDMDVNPSSVFKQLKEEVREETPAAPAQPVHAIPHLLGSTLEDQLAHLRQIAEHWRPAKELGTLRTTMVFATGSPRSPIMFIGEAPGFQEERQREPFVGPAGEKLNSILKAMGLERASIYISNIVKFRPSLPGQTTNNRPPGEGEIAACLPIITKEVELIRPKVIVALGATAAKGLLGTEQTPLSALRGKFHAFAGVPVRVTYHPSYLLRTDTPTEKRKVWEDMLAVMELLQMEISEKQRNFFLTRPS